VFYQNLAHEVLPHTARYDSMRQYVGWRLTTSERAMFVDCIGDKGLRREYADTDLVRDTWRHYVFEKQGVPPLPSGQRPPLYARSHMNFYQSRMAEWARGELVQSLTKVSAGGDKILPVRFAPSLADADFPLFAPYTDAEIAKHTPVVI
jgi:hypothetical protein